MPFHTFQLVKSLPFQIPGKGTRGERPRIERYIEYPRGSPFRSVLFFFLQNTQTTVVLPSSSQKFRLSKWQAKTPQLDEMSKSKDWQFLYVR